MRFAVRHTVTIRNSPETSWSAPMLTKLNLTKDGLAEILASSNPEGELCKAYLRSR